MTKVLVTGGLGYIGSHTVVELSSAGYEVVIADNLSNSKLSVLERISKITNQTYEFYNIDCCDYSSTKEIFEKNKIDSIIHFAGLKSVSESIQKPIDYYSNNIESIITIQRLICEHNISKLIFSSSATVYGELSDPPFTEDSPTGACTNPYGWTKWMIEQMLRDFSNASNDKKVVILRYFNPVGAHDSGLIGEDPNGIPNNLFPYITGVLSGKYEKLTIYGDDYDTIDGTCIRDYIHVCDLAQGHVKALQYMQNSRAGVDVFNLGTGRGTSVKQVVDAFEKSLGHSFNYEIGPRREGDLPVAYANTLKAKEILQFCAKRSIDDMCTSSIKWQTEINEITHD